MTEQKNELIRNLMNLNKSIDTQEKYIKTLLESIRKAIPEVEHISIAEIREDVINEIIPVYDQYFTEEQLEELNKFFQTEVGTLYHKFMNQMSIESYKVGEKVGEIISTKIKKLQNGKNN